MKVIQSFDAELELRSSLGIVKNYYSTPDQVQDPVGNYNLFLDMYENDAVLTTAIDTTVDVGTTNGFYFITKKDQESVVESEDELKQIFYEDLDYDSIAPNLWTSLLIYGDVFVEKRRTDNVIKELHVLETTEMVIKYDQHGRVEGYQQRPWGIKDQNNKQLKIDFSSEDIIHIALKRIGSGIYSRSPFKSIEREYATKKRSISWVSTIFTNFPPRLLYVLKNASKPQVKQFIDNLKIAKNSPHKDIVALGETDVKQTGFSGFDTGLVELLNYLRQEILMITKVPPIWIGIPDNSNRSNSEAQIRSFETRIKSIQNKIESAFNKQLLPELGFKETKFKHKPFSLLEEQSILNNAEKMKSIGVDIESIQKYLFDKGLEIELAEPVQIVNPMENNINTGNNTTQQSQAIPGQENLNNRITGVDQQARQADSARKLKEVQMKMMSTLDKYPYTYDKGEINA